MPDIYALLTPDVLEQARFRKSPRSDSSGSCVEVATNLLDTTGAILVRDSKNPTGPVLAFTVSEWQAFVGGVEDGAFHL